MNVSNIEKDLDMIISSKMKLNPIVSRKWQWKILNEYPEPLKELVLAWAKDETLPLVKYSNVSVERIINGTGLDFLEAVDLLYIIYKDPLSGYDIFSSFLRRDRIRKK